ncbi:hypothetical protein L6452_38210 [Arctium lappa]|uniref:Uncharacterized protein n=1 Tax=Arctium lappa TaxID=4217 RepID=A0ACB8Y540_ARCLA|nr:hypothetical protein L6452_38210 [Arctium lappa]
MVICSAKSCHRLFSVLLEVKFITFECLLAPCKAPPIFLSLKPSYLSLSTSLSLSIHHPPNQFRNPVFRLCFGGEKRIFSELESVLLIRLSGFFRWN